MAFDPTKFVGGLLQDRNIWGVKTPTFYKQLAEASKNVPAGSQTLGGALGSNFSNLLSEAEMESNLQGGLGFIADYAFTPKTQGFGSPIPYFLKSYVAANQAASQPYANLGKNISTLIDYQKSNLTDDIKEYNLAKSEGYANDFNTFLLDKKRAGAINLNMGKTIGDAAFESMNTAIQGAETARINNVELDQMLNIVTPKDMGGKGLKTGFGSETKAQLTNALQMIDPTFNAEGLADAEIFTAYANKVVLPQVKQLGFNPTDADLRFVVAASPTLGKSTAGNLALLETLKIKNNYQEELGDFTTKWLQTNEEIIDDPKKFYTKYNIDKAKFIQSWQESKSDQFKALRGKIERIIKAQGTQSQQGYSINKFKKSGN